MSSNYSIKKTDEVQSWGAWTWELPWKLTLSNLTQIVSNSLHAYRCNDLMSLFAPFYAEGRSVSVCRFPGQTQLMITKSELIKKVLKPSRCPAAGFFHNETNGEVWLPILQALLEATVTADDFLLTANHVPKIKLYRKLLKSRLNIDEEKLADFLKSCITDCPKLSGTVNMTVYTRAFTTLVISRLVGYNGDWEKCTELGNAVDQVNKFAMRKQLHKSQAEDEKDNYQSAITVIRKAVKDAVNNRVEKSGTLIDVLMAHDEISPIQAEATVFLAYFAGSETAALLLSSFLWHLGSNEKWQNELVEDPVLFDKFFHEAIRMCPPVPFLGRHPDRNLKVTTQEETYYVTKGDIFLTSPFFAARDPGLFTNSKEFHPYLDEEEKAKLSWCPFGYGAHYCLGEKLAREEIKAFILHFVRTYQFKSLSSEHPEMEGYLTMKLEEDVYLRLENRAKPAQDK